MSELGDESIVEKNVDLDLEVSPKNNANSNLIHGDLLDIEDEINSILQHHDSPGSQVKSSKPNTESHSGSHLDSSRSNSKDLDDLDIGPLDKLVHFDEKQNTSKTVSRSQSPINDRLGKLRKPLSSQEEEIRRNSTLVSITSENALGGSRKHSEDDESSKISAYARLDFENFTFFVQTLQVVLGRKSNEELLQSSHHAVDVHLSSKKAISRRHAKIFYNFGTQRFELSILGRNGAFVDDLFVEKGITVPLIDGTKIQVGDIPFQFVLPSIEPSEEDDKSSNENKQFNPTDAINLRSNLYNPNSKIKKSPKKETVKTEKSLSIVDENVKNDGRGDIIVLAQTKSVKSPQAGRKPSIESSKLGELSSESKPNDMMNRRNSLLKIRRLSNARRKSLASAASDELNDILKELGVTSIDAIDEEDSELLDSQIQSLLQDHTLDQSGNEIGLEQNLLKLAQYNESAIEEEEDEIDRLVKQHNLEQGVIMDDDFSRSESIHEIDKELSVLDQEIASLAPLLDNQNEDMVKDIEEKKRRLELERKRKQQQRKLVAARAMAKGLSNTSNYLTGSSSLSIPIDPAFSHSSTSHSASPPTHAGGSPPLNLNNTRSTPLMGKPAIPRMGKPASIQPPANRLYNRPLNGLPKSQVIDSRLSNAIPGMSGHLMGGGFENSQMRINQLMPYSTIPKPIIPPRPPQPKLESPVLSITAEPSTIRPRPPLRAITVSAKPILTTFEVPKTIEEPSKYPKLPRRRRESKKQVTKKVYSLDEIPEQYRTKPNISFPGMITNVLKAPGNNEGLSITELNDSIKDVYPYYKYCPEGWQFSVSHNVKLHKIFKRTIKRGNEWVYVMDELFINEREKVRAKQQAMAASRAKAAAIKAEEIKQKQRLEAQQAMSHNLVGRSFTSPYSLPLNTTMRMPQSQFISQLQNKQPPGTNPVTVGGQKPKTIAELASEIKRDSAINSNAPLYFKPQSSIPSTIGSDMSKSSTSPGNATPHANSIKAQLAANRSHPNSQSPQSLSASSPVPPSQGGMNQDTKKSLTYLQKELFTLYKARKLSYNTATTTEIITKALATTIAQVNVIGAKAGCGENALSFLVEKAPQQVSKILDIALTKSIKEKQGNFSRPASRSGTPGPGPGSSGTSPTKSTLTQRPLQSNTPSRENVNPDKNVLPTNATPSHGPPTKSPTVSLSQSTPSHTNNPTDLQQRSGQQPTRSESSTGGPPNATKALAAAYPQTSPSDTKQSNNGPTGELSSTRPSVGTTPSSVPQLSKPPQLGSGLSRPPSYRADSLGRPPNFSSNTARPQSFGKPSALSRPPTFLSNKQTRVGDDGMSKEDNKRELPDQNDGELPRKIIKTENS
jgi:Transcription factor of the Forkhead/HNF3 family